MMYHQHHWPISGHDWAVRQLGRAIENNRIGHAYLLNGPAAIGKTTLARTIAMVLNCEHENRPCGVCRSCKLIARNAHPDFTIIEAEREGGTLKIDQIRELQHTLSLRPYEARYKVAILRRFHEANAATQNAILKTLEEPASYVVLILTVEEMEFILPTIQSRCQLLNLRPLPLEETQNALLHVKHDRSQEEVDLIARLSGGRLGWAIKTLEDPTELDARNAAMTTLSQLLHTNSRVERFEVASGMAKDKDVLFMMLRYWLTFWRDALLIATGSETPIINIDLQARLYELTERVDYGKAHQALSATQETIQQLGRNANTRLALEVLMLKYPVG